MFFLRDVGTPTTMPRCACVSVLFMEVAALNLSSLFQPLHWTPGEDFLLCGRRLVPLVSVSVDVN